VISGPRRNLSRAGDNLVQALDGMAIWVRDGAVICYAKEGRQRRWNEVGQVVKVELYGKKNLGDDADR
jgi:hypothetical protein